jgi:hypothetical protein
MSELQAMVAQLMAQIAAMQNTSGEVAPRPQVPTGVDGGFVNSFAEFNRSSQKLNIGGYTKIITGKVKPVAYDRNLNKVVLYVAATDASSLAKPWVAFSTVAVTVNGLPVRTLYAGSESAWRFVTSDEGKMVYAITVYEGNAKLAAKASPNFSVSLETVAGEKGDSWSVWVPKSGITTWSKGTSHVSYGPSRYFAYAIDAGVAIPYVTITGITAGAQPIISGNSEERVTNLGFSISAGDKVYGSGAITPVMGKWSHKVTESLASGAYEVVVSVDNKVVARKKFTVGTTTAGNVPAITISSPLSGATIKTATPLTLSWKQTGLTGQQAIVRLYNDKVERTISSKPISLDRGVATVRIPFSDDLGVVATDKYSLALSVVGLKDGDPKSINEAISVNVISNVPDANIGLVMYLNDVFFSSSKDATEAQALASCKLNAGLNPTYSMKCVWNGTTIFTSTAVPPTTATGKVLGASVNMYDEILKTLSTISVMVGDLK